MRNFTQSVMGDIQRVRSPELGQIIMFRASKATLQHKECNVREDCCTFDTFSSNDYSRNCMPESPARRLLPAGALLHTHVELLPSEEIHNITSSKQEGHGDTL